VTNPEKCHRHGRESDDRGQGGVADRRDWTGGVLYYASTVDRFDQHYVCDIVEQHSSYVKLNDNSVDY
jgi:hypothetical protein